MQQRTYIRPCTKHNCDCQKHFPVWVALDGKEFDSRDACVAHELALKREQRIQWSIEKGVLVFKDSEDDPAPSLGRYEDDLEDVVWEAIEGSKTGRVVVRRCTEAEARNGGRLCD